MWYESLAHVNAALNGTSAILLVLGYRAVRRKAIGVHARFMVAAFVTSSLFLASYVTYHILAGHKTYSGGGPLHVVYLAILGSHIVLAVVTVPLAVTTLILAATGRFERHRRLARWTFPIWIYVSVTGVVVYLMLYSA
jgi:putative membrane protein